jgi:hypothetical protein
LPGVVDGLFAVLFVVFLLQTSRGGPSCPNVLSPS